MGRVKEREVNVCLLDAYVHNSLDCCNVVSIFSMQVVVTVSRHYTREGRGRVPKVEGAESVCL